MKKWQDLLDSFSTKGGNIVVLFVCSMLLSILFLHVSHHDPSVVEDIKTTLAGFTGALLMALNGNSSRQQMADRIDTLTPGSSTTSTVSAGKVETMNVTQPEAKP